MIVAASHDNSVLQGGIGSGRSKPPGRVDVEPIAWLTPNGVWKRILCDENHPKECKRFKQEYLSKPHTYSVISADGRGATVNVVQMDLDKDCFGYGGEGTTSGASISYAAVAADSIEFFASGAPASRLTDTDAVPIRKALAATAREKLDSVKAIRVYSVELEGQHFFLVQRAFQDFVNRKDYDPHEDLSLIFAVGTMGKGGFHLLMWKEDTVDDNEQVLGLVHLKNGRDFLITTTSDPESQHFRIYGMRDGKLAIVFEGGGGGC